jgi:hypothetical protein
LPAERHAQRHQEQEDPDYPGELSRELVGPEQEDLHHVNEDDRNHEVGAPPVQRADEPPKGHFVVQGLQTIPGFCCGRHVDERQENSGRKLQQKDDQRSTAEHVPPARRVARHRMFHHVANRRRQLEAQIEPFADFCDQAHGGRFPALDAVGPGVGNSPA